MTLPLEAKKIIESLADGIDPVTGEILSEQSAFNSAQVVRALFVAAKARDRAVTREQRDSSLPDNTGKSWSDEEDNELLAAFDAGISPTVLATKHGRTQGAIASRLVRLGRIEERVDTNARA